MRTASRWKSMGTDLWKGFLFIFLVLFSLIAPLGDKNLNPTAQATGSTIPPAGGATDYTYINYCTMKIGANAQTAGINIGMNGKTIDFDVHQLTGLSGGQTLKFEYYKSTTSLLLYKIVTISPNKITDFGGTAYQPVLRVPARGGEIYLATSESTPDARMPQITEGIAGNNASYVALSKFFADTVLNKTELDCTVFDGNVDGRNNLPLPEWTAPTPGSPPKLTIPGAYIKKRGRAITQLVFKFTHVIVKSGNATVDDNVYYFTLEDQPGADDDDPRFANLAIKIIPVAKTWGVFTSGESDALAVDKGELNNYQDDSNNEAMPTYKTIGYAKVKINKALTYDRLVNWTYKMGTDQATGECDRTKVVGKTPPADYEAAVWRPEFSPRDDCIELTGTTLGGSSGAGSGSGAAASGGTASSAKGWIAEWGASVNTASVSNPSGSTEDAGACTRIPVKTGFSGVNFLALLNRGLCEVLYFIYTIGQNLATKGKDILDRSLSIRG